MQLCPHLFSKTVIIKVKPMTKPTQIEIDHQLEKLEFALAFSQTIGDKIKSDKIKDQIKIFGFNYEEPGT